MVNFLMAMFIAILLVFIVILLQKKSIIPLILGTVEETDSSTIVKIKIRLDLYAIIFLIIWFSFVLIACMDSLNIIPLLMLIAGILMITIPTKKEKNKAKEKLEELLKD